MDPVHRLYMEVRTAQMKVKQTEEEEKKSTGDLKAAFSTITAANKVSLQTVEAQYISTLQGLQKS